MRVHQIGSAIPSIAEDGSADCNALGLPLYGAATADEVQRGASRSVI